MASSPMDSCTRLKVLCCLLGLVLLVTSLCFASSASAAKKLPYDSLSIATAPSFTTASKWDHRALTFGFVNGTGDIAGDGEKQAVRDAFNLWSQSTPLVFEEVEAAKAEIVISWGTGNHGDGYPFDGQNGTLAHAFYPSNGDTHFDDDESWTTATRANANQPIDLVTVAAHEIGHAIGLGHSADSGALMYEYYLGSHRFLSSDDVNGALYLYASQYGPENQRIIGFQANTGVLWFHSSYLGGGWNVGSTMATDTSPSIAYVPGDGYVLAFQGTDNKLRIYRAADGKLTNTQLGMAKGTNPSIASGGNGKYVVAFQANNGELWYYDSASQWGYGTKSGMAAGTNPSTAHVGGPGYVVAFQSWQNELVTYSISNGSWNNTKLGMKAGSSPSIGAMPSGGNYAIAFQDWQNQLWLYSSQTGTGGNSTLGMEPNSSPSVAVAPDGTYIAAFQANNNELWYYSSAGGWGFSTKSGMAPATSPSASLSPGGGYAIAFQDWKNGLWTFSTLTGSWANLSLGMKAGTSPAGAAR